MFLTYAECRTYAEEKLAEADRDKRHRKRLITAAEGWLFLASQLRRLEKTLGYDEVKK
jgi:hypothetical protein